MYSVYLNEYIDPKAVELLKAQARIVNNFDHIEELDAIVLRNIPVTAEMMERATRLRVIGKHGVGVNTIDLKAADRHGITVLNTPTTNADSVAELVVALILSLERKLYEANQGCRQNAYQKIAPDALVGTEISGKVLGQVGMGNIACRAARILRNGFGVTALGYDPFVSAEEAEKRGFKKVETVQEIIEQSDIINISVPLTEGTRDLISGEMFRHFRKGAILINASRGGIVNEDDLYEALVSGKLKGAACDAFLNEPPTSENKLLSLSNFSATPHIGGSTDESLERTGIEVVEQVLRVLNGELPAHPVHSR